MRVMQMDLKSGGRHHSVISMYIVRGAHYRVKRNASKFVSQIIFYFEIVSKDFFQISTFLNNKY